MHVLRQPRRISQLLNFRLYLLHDLGRAPIVRLLEGRFGITRREWRLLGVLTEHGARSPSSLAEVARLDRARTSRTIGLLVEKGLVSRLAMAADPRRARVELTAQGQALYGRVFPEIARINGELAAALDDDALRAFDEALERLTERARELDRVWAVDVKTQRRQGGSRRLLAAPQEASPGSQHAPGRRRGRA